VSQRTHHTQQRTQLHTLHIRRTNTNQVCALPLRNHRGNTDICSSFQQAVSDFLATGTEMHYLREFGSSIISLPWPQQQNVVSTSSVIAQEGWSI
jgi:hypothetical protein